MTKPYTGHFKEQTGAVSGEAPVYLLEITHPQLVVAIRVVNDSVNLVSNGNTFIAMPFRISLPDDIQSQIPRARLSIDNVGRELVQWLDSSGGGRGAQVRVMQVMRDTPNVIEFDITLDLLNVRQSALEVTGQLGFENVLNIPALAATYRPDTAPGLF